MKYSPVQSLSKRKITLIKFLEETVVLPSIGTKLPGWIHREKNVSGPKEAAGDERVSLSSHTSLSEHRKAGKQVKTT